MTDTLDRKVRYDDPIDYINRILRNRNQTRDVLIPIFGNRKAVGEIMNRSRFLNIGHVRRLVNEMNMDANPLVQCTRPRVKKDE